MLLTYKQFVETATAADLDGHSFSPGEAAYLGYVPVTWGSSPMTEDIQEADDYKEVGPFQASSLEEAHWIMLQTFGLHCEIEVL
jgi:hypothetical protein